MEPGDGADAVEHGHAEGDQVKAFILRRGSDHVLPNQSEDLSIEDAPSGWYFSLTRELRPPVTSVRARVLAALSGRTDFPFNANGWPILSRKALDLLRAAGDFPVRVVPVDIFLKGEPLSEEYVVVQLLQHEGVLDLGASDWVPGALNPNAVGSVRRMVLASGGSELPPLFRVREYPVELLVSDEGRRALLAGGVTGIEYLEVQVSQPAVG